MSDPEATQPPRQPNTPRVWLKRLWAVLTAFVAAHPDKAIICFAFALVIAVLAL